MKYLVLLAGCGLGDGSCIEEVILTYVALDKYGCDYTPVAEDVSIQSVNHLTEQMAERRNILIEAARIGVEEHILCHKGAYTGKSGITRDRTGKPWYYRNLKR